MVAADRLQVLMNGSPVGWLSRRSNGIVSLNYDPAWLANANTRPLSLSLPLTTQVYSGDRVENFFDNLLPDNISLRNRLQVRTGAASTRAFDLLYHIGRDCVGALQLVPEGESIDVKKITASKVDDEQIETILQSHNAMPLGVDLDSDFRLSWPALRRKRRFLKYGIPGTSRLGPPQPAIFLNCPWVDSGKANWTCLKAWKTNGYANSF